MNVKSIDRNVRALSAVERMWTLPGLPDMVKLDVATMSGLTVEGIQEFAWGLQRDIDTVRQAPAAAPKMTVRAPDPVPARGLSTGERIQQITQATAGFSAPKRLEGPGSVTAWKERAVGLGYLDGNTAMDTSWDPAFNSVLHQMRMDDYNRRMSGDKPGPSASIGEIAEFFDDWLVPTGLLHAAMEMDFLPDPGKIASEWEKGWWHALDDIALPVVNLALMFTGVAEVGALVRGLHIAHKGVDGWRVAHGALKVRNVGRAGRIYGRAADTADDIRRIQQPGLIGARLQRAGEGTRRAAVGRGMEGWRQLKGTMLAKKTVQQGMRIGFAGRLENRFTDYDGYGLEDWAPEWVDAAGRMRHHPAVFLLGEMAFTPVHILQPGQITNPFGFVKSFSNIGQDAWIGDEAVNAVRHSILNPVDDVPSAVAQTGNVAPPTSAATLAEREAAAKTFDRRVKELGPHGAVKERFGFHPTNDDETYTAWLTWMMTMGAIDAASAGLSMAKSGDSLVGTVVRHSQDFHTARNKLVSQMRYIDPGNQPELLWSLAWRDARTPKDAKAKFLKYMDSVFGSGDEIDDVVVEGLKIRQENLGKLIDIHNQQRLELWKELLDQHAKPGVLSNQMAHSLDTMGAWDEFTDAMADVDMEFLSGALNGATFKTPVSPITGRPVAAAGGAVLKGPEPIFGGMFTTTDVVDVLSDPEFIRFTHDSKGIFKPFLTEGPKNGRFTVAKIGTVTKQDKLTELAVIRRLRHLQYTVRRLENRSVYSKVLKEAEKHFTPGGAGFTSVKVADLNRIMDDMSLGTETQRRIRRMRKYAIDNNIDIAAVDSHLTKRLKDIDQSPHWSAKYGIDSTLDLRKKMIELRRQANFTASEVDADSIPLGLSDSLSAKGYKLVHGVEFAAPADLAHLPLELRDLVAKGQYKSSWGMLGLDLPAWVPRPKGGVPGLAKGILRGVGRSVERADPVHATMMYRSALRNGLQRSLLGVAKSVRDFNNPAGNDLSKLMDQLQKIARDIGEKNRGIVRDKEFMGPWDPNRLITNVTTSFAPAQPTDLVRTKRLWNETDAVLKSHGYSAEERLAIFHGLKQSRVVGPQLRGRFTHWQDKLQATPALTNSMRLLGRQVTDGGYTKTATAFGVKAVPTIGMGFLYGAQVKNEDDSLVRTFMGATAAVGFGRMGGGKAIQRWMKATPTLGMQGKYTSKMRLMGRAADALESGDAARHWAYLPDRLATMRDYFRFCLSPIFDASRYSEALILSQIGDIPEEVVRRGGLRFNMSPSAWRADRRRSLTGKGKKFTKNAEVDVYKHEGRWYTQAEADTAGVDLSGKTSVRMNAATVVQQDWDRSVAEFSQIASRRKDFDYDALEAGTARFRQIGILGFNTHEWMASMYTDLVRLHGVAPERAYEIARKSFTYGVNPRSPAEMNVNAVFFPFSFGKKAASHAAKFAMQDWSRAAMMNDSIKVYEMLSERYDLSDLWRDHLPAINKLYRLNIFAYGITPGEFGGANRPFVDFFNSTPAAEGITDPIVNLFLPQGYDMRHEEDVFNIEKMMRRVAPVFNDINHLLDDMAAQGHVLTGGTWMTKEAEASEGFRQVSELERMVHDTMIEQGVREGIGAIRRKRFVPLKSWLDDQKEQIRSGLPGYREALTDVTTNSILAAQDRRSHEASYDPGVGPVDRMSKVGYLLASGDALIDRAGGIDYVPPAARDALLTIASSWAKDDDYVRMKWRHHMRRIWGPIETELL